MNINGAPTGPTATMDMTTGEPTALGELAASRGLAPALPTAEPTGPVTQDDRVGDDSQRDYTDYILARYESQVYIRLLGSGHVVVNDVFSGDGPAHGNWDKVGTYLHLKFNQSGDNAKLQYYKFAPIDPCADTWVSVQTSQQWHAVLLHVNVDRFRRPRTAATI
jgi:hypothetical protein